MKTTPQQAREIDTSLKREDAYWRKQARIERLGRCPECLREPRYQGGRCLDCRGRSMGGDGD